LKINTQAVDYRDGEVSLTGLFVWDTTLAGKRAGAMVVHGGAGLDDHAKDRARRLAELGYVVFACDLYGQGVAGDRQRVMARITELRSDPAKLVQRAAAGIEVLRSHPLVDGHIAAVGYCFGGMTVLELARSGADLMGVVSVHGSLDTRRPSQPDAVKAKILVCHGALDPHVPMTHVNAFVEEMNTAGADWQLLVYGNAMHGFTHESGPKLPGVEYHALTDARSSQAIQSFFAELFAAPKGEKTLSRNGPRNNPPRPFFGNNQKKGRRRIRRPFPALC
jgi:dienelactone hydrolase